MTTTYRERLEHGVARRGRWRAHARRLPTALLVGAGLLLLFAVVAVAAPLLAPYRATGRPGLPLTGPSWDLLFGTDVLGRDVFSRVVFGTREDLFLSLVS